MRTGYDALRAAWLAAASQSLGTLLFNVSTGAALQANSLLVERDLVWAPNAEGSVAFLVSGGFSLLMLARSSNLWGPASPDWTSSRINMLGCVAFGVSAFAATILSGGVLENGELSSWRTFVGAACFFLASAVLLPDSGRDRDGEVAGPGLADQAA